MSFLLYVTGKKSAYLSLNHWPKAYWRFFPTWKEKLVSVEDVYVDSERFTHVGQLSKS